jgi:phospholipid N-methyltransferase
MARGPEPGSRGRAARSAAEDAELDSNDSRSVPSPLDPPRLPSRPPLHRRWESGGVAVFLHSRPVHSGESIILGDTVNSNPSDANAADSALVESTLREREACFSDVSLFFKKFLAKGRTISSAVPSSPAMVSGLLRHIDFSKPGTIVELGAGTGPVTQQVVEQLRSFHRFVAVENDPDFCAVLRRRFPETTLLQIDAGNIGESLSHLGIHRVDYVLSGLPTPNLPPRTLIRLWRWLAEALSPGGLFIQITVAPIVFRGFYERLFQDVNYRMVWLNLPPGGIYRCARPRRRPSPRRAEPQIA